MRNVQKIVEALEGAGKVKVAVFGDYCLDKYLYMDPARDEESVETGLMAWQIHEKKKFPGAGGTVVNNLRALGVQTVCIGLMGDDGEGYELQKALEHIGADTRLMVKSDCVCTSTYTKPMRLQPDGSWLVEGTAPLDKLEKMLDVDLDEEADDYDTFGGLVFGTLGRVLADDETVTVQLQGLEVQVLQVENRHMRLARVKVLPQQQE